MNSVVPNPVRFVAALFLLAVPVTAQTVTFQPGGFAQPIVSEFVTVAGVTYWKGTAKFEQSGRVLQLFHWRDDVPDADLHLNILVSPWGGDIALCWDCPLPPPVEFEFIMPLGMIPGGQHRVFFLSNGQRISIGSIPQITVPSETGGPLRLHPMANSLAIEVLGLNNVGYVVEESTDLMQWSRILELNGPGTGQRPLSADGQPKFYRLQMSAYPRTAYSEGRVNPPQP